MHACFCHYLCFTFGHAHLITHNKTFKGLAVTFKFESDNFCENFLKAVLLYENVGSKLIKNYNDAEFTGKM